MSKSGPQYFSCYNNGGMRPEDRVKKEKEEQGDDFVFIAANRADRRRRYTNGFLMPAVPKAYRGKNPGVRLTHGPRHLRVTNND